MAKLIFKAHLVKDLWVKLLIGIDILGDEAIILDFYKDTAIIGSYEGLQFPINIKAKPQY